MSGVQLTAHVAEEKLALEKQLADAKGDNTRLLGRVEAAESATKAVQAQLAVSEAHAAALAVSVVIPSA